MTMEEITRLLDRLVERVKTLEQDALSQYYRVYDLESKVSELEYNIGSLESQVTSLEATIDWTPPNG